MASHVKDFERTITERMEEIVRGTDPQAKLESLLSFYRGLLAIEEHSHAVGNQEGLKHMSKDLLEIVERIKPRVFKLVDQAQMAVYLSSHIQQNFPF